MNKKVEIVLAKYGCLFMKDDNKEMFSEIEEVYKEALDEALTLPDVVKSLNDKEVKNIEIKSLGDLKRAYPDGTSHTVNSYGRIINYSVDREIVYTRHI